MKIIRTLFLIVLFVLGVLVATQNTQAVRFAYLPDASWSPIPGGAAIELPLFLLVLGCVVLGAALAGVGTFVEQVRLRTAARRQTKLATKMTKERDAAVSDLDRAKEQLEDARAAAQQAERRAEQVCAEAAEQAAVGTEITSDATASA